jgi:hypothetical protein
MHDRFGVPDSMFGPVPDDFYGLIGRIALVFTMLEDRLLGLLWALDDEHAGRPASQIATLTHNVYRAPALPLGGDFDGLVHLRGAADAIHRNLVCHVAG